MAGLAGQLEGQQRQARVGEEELERERALANELGCRVLVLGAELERLHREGMVMSREQAAKYGVLEEEYGRLVRRVQDKNAEIDSLIAKINALEGK